MNNFHAKISRFTVHTCIDTCNTIIIKLVVLFVIQLWSAPFHICSLVFLVIYLMKQDIWYDTNLHIVHKIPFFHHHLASCKSNTIIIYKLLRP